LENDSFPFWGGIQGLFSGAFAVKLGLRECDFATIFVQFALHFLCCSLFFAPWKVIGLEILSMATTGITLQWQGVPSNLNGGVPCPAMFVLGCDVLKGFDLIQSKTIKNTCTVSKFMGIKTYSKVSLS